MQVVLLLAGAARVDCEHVLSAHLPQEVRLGERGGVNACVGTGNHARRSIRAARHEATWAQVDGPYPWSAGVL